MVNMKYEFLTLQQKVINTLSVFKERMHKKRSWGRKRVEPSLEHILS